MPVPPDVLDACRETLASLPLDAAGTASSEDLRTAFQGSEGPLPKALWDELFAHMDVNGDGRVSLAELVASMAGLVGPGANTPMHRFTFDLFDRDGDGTIDLDELRTALVALKRSGDNHEALMQQADLDGDGRLEYVEFLHLLTL